MTPPSVTCGRRGDVVEVDVVADDRRAARRLAWRLALAVDDALGGACGVAVAYAAAHFAPGAARERVLVTPLRYTGTAAAPVAVPVDLVAVRHAAERTRAAQPGGDEALLRAAWHALLALAVGGEVADLRPAQVSLAVAKELDEAEQVVDAIAQRLGLSRLARAPAPIDRLKTQ